MSPLAGLPLFGGLVELLDTAIAQLGFPLWLRGFVELVIVALLAYMVLRLLATQALPWLGTALVGPVVGVAELLRAVLLVPDYAISLLFRQVFKRIPPEFLYGYGVLVMGAVDGVQSFARRGLPTLSITRRANKALLTALVVLGFLAWNSSECVPAAEACVSPVAYWQTSLTTWFDEKAATP